MISVGLSRNIIALRTFDARASVSEVADPSIVVDGQFDFE
jgi:hypothetical protein